VQPGGGVVVVPRKAQGLVEVGADVDFALAVGMDSRFPYDFAVVVLDALGTAAMVREVVVALAIARGARQPPRARRSPPP
jgi:hypothetical protein